MADDSELDADIAEWRLALQTGRIPDPMRTQHPDLIARLRESLSAEERLVWLSGPAAVFLEFDPHTTATIPQVPYQPFYPPEPHRLLGNYDLLERLGRGPMCEVYRARDRRDGRVVALKLTARSPYDGPRRRAESRELLRLLTGLSHPGIVRLYEVGEDGNYDFLAMEFCEGGSLADRLARDRRAGSRIESREAARLVAELAAAVHFAHSHMLIHRDLKPSNVLLTADGRPKIADFGLATWADSDALATTTGVGTPAYMAPEQFAGRLAPSCDIYALGVILYELLTGRLPFGGRMFIELIRQVMNTEPVPPRRENPGVPRELEAICLRCLEKNPDRRYPTARNLADDLGRFLRGQSLGEWFPPRGGFFGRLWRRLRRG